jgi:hypothetical protein
MRELDDRGSAFKNGRIDPSKSPDQIRFDWERNADPMQLSRRMGSVADRAIPEQAVRRPPLAPRQE